MVSYQTAFDLMQPYIKNTQVGICPSDSDAPDVDLSPFLPGTIPVSYTANDKLSTVPMIGSPAPPNLAQIQQSSRLPLIWDANVDLTAAPIAPPIPNVIARRRHLEGANCAFVDGHVKWIKNCPRTLRSDSRPSLRLLERAARRRIAEL